MFKLEQIRCDFRVKYNKSRHLHYMNERRDEKEKRAQKKCSLYIHVFSSEKKGEKEVVQFLMPTISWARGLIQPNV